MNAIKKAKILIETGAYKDAYKLLEPLIKKKNTEALFLFSSFSINESESLKDFELRSFKLIKEAAENNFPDAIYTLGVIYETGDGVKSDIRMASSLFKKAAEAGHSRAKLSYGLDLYYGSNGIIEDKNQGLIFIREAQNEAVEGAHEILKKIIDSES